MRKSPPQLTSGVVRITPQIPFSWVSLLLPAQMATPRHSVSADRAYQASNQQAVVRYHGLK